MTGGVALSEDLRATVIYMHDSSGLDAKTISQLTGIPRRTVHRILSTWKATGIVKPAPQGRRGRPRALDLADTEVLVRAVNDRNDRYLEELQAVLEERCGVRVSEATVWRTLQRVGFRMKEVISSSFWFATAHAYDDLDH
ncbi:Homeodomain-like protein [Schizopora paradoxa]|uniref:Homeodomain-like protein n=1 Tax=Schizopora paradoxa TaxID=27342 RepID=A0A0H2R530_9AGAM|nr:Homeodomain-like protein [Schizopora paradoxa]